MELSGSPPLGGSGVIIAPRSKRGSFMFEALPVIVAATVLVLVLGLGPAIIDKINNRGGNEPSEMRIDLGRADDKP